MFSCVTPCRGKYATAEQCCVRDADTPISRGTLCGLSCWTPLPRQVRYGGHVLRMSGRTAVLPWGAAVFFLFDPCRDKYATAETCCVCREDPSCFPWDAVICVRPLSRQVRYGGTVLRMSGRSVVLPWDAVNVCLFDPCRDKYATA